MLARNGREGLDDAERSHMSSMPQLLGEPAPRLLDVRGFIDRHRFSAKTYPVENRNPNPAFRRSRCRLLQTPPYPENTTPAARLCQRNRRFLV